MVDGVDFVDDVDAEKDHLPGCVHFVHKVHAVHYLDKPNWPQLPSLGSTVARACLCLKKACTMRVVGFVGMKVREESHGGEIRGAAFR